MRVLDVMVKLTHHFDFMYSDQSNGMQQNTSHPYKNTVTTRKIQLLRIVEKPLAGAMHSLQKSNDTTPLSWPL
jgi:hypothetical protein